MHTPRCPPRTHTQQPGGEDAPALTAAGTTALGTVCGVLARHAPVALGALAWLLRRVTAGGGSGSGLLVATAGLPGTAQPHLYTAPPGAQGEAAGGGGGWGGAAASATAGGDTEPVSTGGDGLAGSVAALGSGAGSPLQTDGTVVACVSLGLGLLGTLPPRLLVQVRPR